MFAGAPAKLANSGSRTLLALGKPAPIYSSHGSATSAFPRPGCFEGAFSRRHAHLVVRREPPRC